jgi:aryl-alcohol dehydrogenase-like predicted oxidoreductase
VDPAVPIEDVAGTVGELVAAGKAGHLGLAAIDAAAAKVTVVGERYPEAMQAMIDR